jgi:hypothetical protein
MAQAQLTRIRLGQFAKFSSFRTYVSKATSARQFYPGDYHITIASQSKQQFFGVPNLPAPARPSLVGFMTTENQENAADSETRKLLHCLDLVLYRPTVGLGAAVSNFTAKLLEKLGYDDDDRIIFDVHFRLSYLEYVLWHRPMFVS